MRDGLSVCIYYHVDFIPFKSLSYSCYLANQSLFDKKLLKIAKKVRAEKDREIDRRIRDEKIRAKSKIDPNIAEIKEKLTFLGFLFGGLILTFLFPHFVFGCIIASILVCVLISGLMGLFSLGGIVAGAAGIGAGIFLNDK
jgi:VIT1/CCC1 family predicted Fe2+/Mn2+ transporter